MKGFVRAWRRLRWGAGWSSRDRNLPEVRPTPSYWRVRAKLILWAAVSLAGWLLAEESSAIRLTGVVRIRGEITAWFEEVATQRQFRLSLGQTDSSGWQLQGVDYTHDSAHLLRDGAMLVAGPWAAAGRLAGSVEDPRQVRDAAELPRSAEATEVGLLRRQLRQSSGERCLELQRELQSLHAQPAVEEGKLRDSSDGSAGKVGAIPGAGDAGEAPPLSPRLSATLAEILARPEPEVGSLAGTGLEVRELRELARSVRGTLWLPRVESELRGYAALPAVLTPP